MNPLMQSKNASPLILIALVCFGLCPTPKAFGVNPPPDGGYANFTTAEGTNALKNVTTGAGNTGVGWYSLFSDITGSLNTSVGAGTLVLNTGDENTATGAGALLSNTTGSFNTANGAFALFSNTTGIWNVANGSLALYSNTIGNNNIALGWNAGFNLTNSSGNIDIGNEGFAGEGSTIRIGSSLGLQTRAFIAGISGATVTGAAVVVDANGQLGVAPSSARFKDNIKAMDSASEAILVLKPVTFRYKKELDPSGISQFGLVAEDVEKINPALVVRDKDGKPYTVRYDAVNAMLLNEFLKEHRKVEQMQKQIEKLTEGLQKVSAQLEVNKPASQMAENNQ